MSRRAPFAGALLVAATCLTAVPASAQLNLKEGPTLGVRPVLMFNQYLYQGSMGRPRSLAVDGGHHEIWVADSSLDRIGIFRPDGAELYSFSSRKYIQDPSRIAVTPSGGIAVIEGRRTAVHLFNYRGDYTGDLRLPGFDPQPVIGAVAWDKDGNVYVGENHSAQVYVYGPDGKLRQQFGSRGADEGQFQAICGIVVGGDGTIYVADQQALAVQLFDRQGNFIRGWGRHVMGSDGFSLPSGLAVDSKGRILVSDELRHQVKVFSPEGSLLGIFGGLGQAPGQLSFPTDVAVDEGDRIYVSERTTARVQVFEFIEPEPAKPEPAPADAPPAN